MHEIVADKRRADRPGQGVDRREPGRPAAVGRQGLPHSRRHPGDTGAGGQPAGVPGHAAQGTQGRAVPGAAQHPRRRGRGRPGRLRHRDHHRGPVLRRRGHQPGRPQHDQGVLLRPAGGQLARRARTSRRSRTSASSAPGMMGAAIAYVCAKAGMAVVLKDVSVEAAERGKGYSERLLDKAIARGRHDRGGQGRPARRASGRPPIRPTSPVSTWSSRPSSRTRR